MRKILTFLFISTFALTSCAQKSNYPGQLEIKGFKIGQEVDTTLFIKKGNIYFPNYLDGWTMDNYDQLPEKYHGLKIAIFSPSLSGDLGIYTLNGQLILKENVSSKTQITLDVKNIPPGNYTLQYLRIVVMER